MDTETQITPNPNYTAMLPLWKQMHDTVEKGEIAVKEAGEEYLPKTDGQRQDTNTGSKRYKAYKQRAVYINFGKRTIKKALGLMHHKDYTVKLPESMSYLKESFTISGDSLTSFARDLNREQLIKSRAGLLVDFSSSEIEAKPYIVPYFAEAIVDWNELDDKSLEFVLLNETRLEFNRESKTWEKVAKYRLLGLATSINEAEYLEPTYYSAVITPKEWEGFDLDNPIDVIVPTIQGKPLNKIPFTFCNATNTYAELQAPVMIDQSNLSLAYYRGDADYRQAIYFQAFAILVLAGFNKDEIEAQGGIQVDGALISSQDGAKASYAQTNGSGLQEMRMSLDTLKKESEREGIVITDKDGVESGKAIATRITLQTSDLLEIAKTGGEAIQKSLEIIAEWLEVKEEVQAIPNSDFNLENEQPRSVFEMWQVLKENGLSIEDYYLWLRKNNYTDFKTFEEWDKALSTQKVDINEPEADEKIEVIEEV